MSADPTRDTGHDDPSPPDVSPWAILMVAASVAFLAAGILLPGLAATFLRLLLLFLALGWVAFRATGAGLPSVSVHDHFTPFDDGIVEPAPRSVPDVVRNHARVLRAVDDPSGGTSRPIPWPMARDLIVEAARRLERGHGLKLARPRDAGRIRALVSHPTRTLLGVRDPTDGGPATGSGQRSVPLGHLDDILDDLERL